MSICCFPTRLAAAAAAVSAAVLGAGGAVANSLAVQLACANDYYAYCSRHNPDSAATRSCMRANGNRLSQRCINALVAAGEVSKAQVARKAASGR